MEESAILARVVPLFLVPLLISFSLQTLEIHEKMCKNTYKSVFEVNVLKSRNILGIKRDSYFDKV